MSIYKEINCYNDYQCPVCGSFEVFPEVNSLNGEYLPLMWCKDCHKNVKLTMTITEKILGGFGISVRSKEQDWPPKLHSITRLTKDDHNEYEVRIEREREVESVATPNES